MRTRRVLEGVGAFLLPAALYLPFLSRHFDLNGVAEARGLDTGNLFSPNHLIYRPIGLLAQDLLAAAGFEVRSVVVLQLISAISGAAGIAFAYLFFKKITESRFIAGVIAFWLGTSWAHWAYNTDAMYIAVATMFAAAALAVFVNGNSRTSVAVAGYLAGFAILVWQANVFLIPIFLLGLWWVKAGPYRLRLKEGIRFLASCSLPVVSLYLVAAYDAGISTPIQFMRWVTSHGSGVGLPEWGQFGFERIRETGQMAIQSLVPYNSIWGLAALVVLGFVFTGTYAKGDLLRRLQAGESRPLLAWMAISYLMYVPFIVWWGPSPEWFMIPNIFLGGILTKAFGMLPRNSAAKVVLAGAAAATAAVNFESTIWQRYAAPKPELQLAACVAGHVQPSDVILATDWNWSGYLEYFWGRRELNFIGKSASSGNREVALRQIRQRVGEVQAFKGNAYIMDPSSYPVWQLDWLRAQTQMAATDFDEFKGEPAFECQGKVFLKVPNKLAEPPSDDLRQEVALSLSPSGAASVSSVGHVIGRSVGYAQIQTDQKQSMGGLAFLEFQSGGAFLEEALLPLAPSVTAARMYVEIGGGVNTSISLTNANNEPASVNFSFRDANGHELRSGILEIPARGQLSRYLTEAPFNARRSLLGTLDLRSTAPVSAIGMRLADNRFGEPVFSRITVADAAIRDGGRRRLLPLSKVGEGWSSSVVLMNPTDETLAGTLLWISADSEHLDQKETVEIEYSIVAHGVQRLMMPDAKRLRRGYIQLQPSAGSPVPVASAVLVREEDNALVGQATIEAVETGAVQDLYVHRRPTAVTTRIILVNPSGRPVSLSMELHRLNGAPVGLPKSLVLQPWELWTASLDEVTEAAPVHRSFEGVLRIMASAGSEFAALSVRDQTRKGGVTVISSIPPLQLFVPRLDRPVAFPHLVYGGGYTSRFVLFNRSNKTSEFSLRFFSSTGHPMRLPVRESTAQ